MRYPSFSASPGPGPTAIAALAATALFTGFARAETAPPGPAAVAQAVYPINVSAGDYDLTVQVLDLPPGSGVPLHTHGGPVVVSVIDGELTLTETNGERVVKAGQSWTEGTGYAHGVVNRTGKNTRIAASYLIPKGLARTTLAK